MKKLSLLLLVLSISYLFLCAKNTLAQNNKFGIHILSEADLADAAELVGENGYVTMVMREDERDYTRWQKTFDEMKRLKIIPIIRIATHTRGNNWIKPSENDAKKWAEFLNSLDWPTESRYIVLFNEPNHAKEWGGEVNPREYASVSRTYWEELKKASFKFFVLPAGLDLSANNTKNTMDAGEFYDLMHQSDELIFTIFDGLASHSYPNPDFSGNARDTGKMSIAGFKWELEYLKKYNLYPNIPVFITETGWANSNPNLSEKYEYAFKNVWNNKRVQAVTPFLLSYQSAPFNVFSWKSPSGEFLPHYEAVMGLAKEINIPSNN